MYMRETNLLDETFQTRSQSVPPNNLGSMHAYACAVFSMFYVQSLVRVMSNPQSVLRAVFSFCYVQSSVYVMCRL